MNPGNGIETSILIRERFTRGYFHINESRQRDWNIPHAIPIFLSLGPFTLMNPGNGIETPANTPETVIRSFFHINESRQRDWNIQDYKDEDLKKKLSH